ncbi:MAG: FHA domain-containing protein [Candidatus Methylomirabilis sp.]|nr:FHA domain-containing protein [Deltaproteobacteria bacterium]
MAFKFRIIANSGILQGKEYEFDKREVAVGQASINDLIINDPDIDPYHAQIRVVKGKLIVEDLKSKRGVRINGIEIDEGELSSGDEVALGDNLFTVVFDETELRKQASSFLGKLSTGFGKEPKTEYERIIASTKAAEIAPKAAPSKRPLIIAATVGFVVLVAGGVYLTGGAAMTGSSEGGADAKPIPLPATGVYGLNPGDSSHPDKVDFSFRHIDGEVLLTYIVSEVSVDDEVEIKVNGNRLGFAPVATGRWTDAIDIRVPAALVKRGEENVITFDNTKNPPASDRWGVRNVSVSTFYFPECNVEDAKKYMELGDTKYEERNVSAENLYRSVRYYARALDFLEKCQGVETDYARMKERYDLANSRLDRSFDEHLFAATKAFQLNDFETAREEVLAAVDLVPNPKDPRFQRAANINAKLPRPKK